MAQRHRVTIREVAAAAGVSAVTVSRVLNNRYDVAPETLRRVQEVIRQTGYAPNMFARGLTQGRSQTIGVVAYGLDYFGSTGAANAIERRATEMGYSISLTLVPDPATGDVDHIFRDLSARQVDGIIWAVPAIGNNRTWSQTVSEALPAPLVVVGDGEPALPSVNIDSIEIGRLATEHLLDGGARNVGIVTGPLCWRAAKQRYEGWRRTLMARGHVPSEHLVVEGDWTASSGEQALYRLLEQCPKVDAVFASDDEMALGVLYAAHRLGVAVPQDLSVVGVDNVEESSHYWPPLTTVYQPVAEAGAMAVEKIVKLISGPGGSAQIKSPAPRMKSVRPALVVRDSSRPVAKTIEIPAGTASGPTSTVGSGISGSNGPVNR